ncbi:cyclodeaminase/cyclohydrolase family protein [Arthrobacter ginkgonis]|uniref:Cyclodeaminase/cyclohydrolase family protein n=1 Tax=Arthrobacter ginkgonis TaxID=1630594 RepID=A0ABP7CDR2_9MICC
MIGSETISDYLERLASREPTPGGGAAGALHAAQGAALVSMVAVYTTGKKYAAHEDRAKQIASRADELISASLQTADDDEAAFTAVVEAYKLPSGSEAERSTRSDTIQRAVLGATEPSLALIRLATEIIELSEELVDFGNPNVVSDIAAAAEAARAAIATALITLQINISALKDAGEQDGLRAEADRAERAIDRAQTVSQRVREKVAA